VYKTFDEGRQASLRRDEFLSGIHPGAIYHIYIRRCSYVFSFEIVSRQPERSASFISAQRLAKIVIKSQALYEYRPR
jgi:hypothetical protein